MSLFYISPDSCLVAILCSNITVDLYITLWYKINLISVDNSLIIYSLSSIVLVEISQCLLAQIHRTFTRSPITFSIRFSSSLQTRLTMKTVIFHWKLCKNRKLDEWQPKYPRGIVAIVVIDVKVNVEDLTYFNIVL